MCEGTEKIEQMHLSVTVRSRINIIVLENRFVFLFKFDFYLLLGYIQSKSSNDLIFKYFPFLITFCYNY